MTSRGPEALRRARLERNLHVLAERAGELARRSASTPALAAANEAFARTGSMPRRAAVVCWDLGHNPAGRAHVLYRLLERQGYAVDLVGPLWERYGTTLWAPLAGEGLNVRTWRCDDLEDFLPAAEALAAARTYDLVHVCKPRLPSLYLGALIKRSSGCPMIVDVDDHEMSFFGRDDPATLAEVTAGAAQALREPHEELATRYAQSLIEHADAVTVSNVALRERVGGHLLRHARDEDRFRPDAVARAAARAHLNIADEEFALMFIGTPRLHKGIAEVAQALHQLDDPSLVFHIVGTLVDPRLQALLEDCPRARLRFHPDCPFDELPRLLAGADLVPLLQDVEHAICRYQIPAKVSDALALGVPVLASATPPLLDLIAQGAVTAVGPDGLSASILALREASRSDGAVADRARRAFLAEFALSVNAARLAHAIDEAAAAPVDLDPPWREAIALMRDEYARRRGLSAVHRSPPGANAMACAQGSSPERISPVVRLGRTLSRLRPPGPHARRRPTGGQGHDIAFFWKQNDSDLYGRRSDMVARYLAASGRVNRVVHFDAPLEAAALEQHFVPGATERGGEQPLLLRQLYERGAGLRDEQRLTRHTFLSSEERPAGRLVDERLRPRHDYARWVRERLEAAGLRPERTWAWFCPVIRDAPALIERIGFAGVVSDLIDDERAWGVDAPALDDSYRRTLALSDVTFANCDALANAMSPHARSISVVPNGAERFLAQGPANPPEALVDISGPIAGYVGNLRDRIDWLLLQAVVEALPHVTFVLAGPAGDDPNARSLASRPNVRLPGLVPYERLPDWLRRFDVGLLPHMNNRLTARMNPLKLYNYFACGLPIVSTELADIDTLDGHVRTASDPAGFVQAIEAALRAAPDTKGAVWSATMNRIAWDARVSTMLDALDAHVQARMSRAG